LVGVQGGKIRRGPGPPSSDEARRHDELLREEKQAIRGAEVGAGRGAGGGVAGAQRRRSVRAERVTFLMGRRSGRPCPCAGVSG
jgi:hypothetical protein